MWARLVVAPWWVLWLVNAAVYAAGLTAICALGLPGFADAGWMWPLVSIVVFSLIATALMTAASTTAPGWFAASAADIHSGVMSAQDLGTDSEAVTGGPFCRQ